MWHRLTKEDGRAVLSGRKAEQPGPGVWVAAVDVKDGGQTTTELIAVDGVEVWRGVCYCGQQRAAAWDRAAALRMQRKGR